MKFEIGYCKLLSLIIKICNLKNDLVVIVKKKFLKILLNVLFVKINQIIVF